jgi:hypothetical protein
VLISPKDVSVKLSFDIWGVLINSKKKNHNRITIEGYYERYFSKCLKFIIFFVSDNENFDNTSKRNENKKAIFKTTSTLPSKPSPKIFLGKTKEKLTMVLSVELSSELITSVNI